MRGKRGLGGLACALAAMLLTACYAGVEHMLEEDYNPRFVMEEPPLQVQEPAPPQHSVFLTTDWMQDEYLLSTPKTDLNLGINRVVHPDYIDDARAEWTVINKDARNIEPRLYESTEGIENGDFWIPSGQLQESDFPLTVTCKILAGSTSCQDQAVYKLKPTP